MKRPMNGRVAVGAPVDLLLLEGPHEALCLGVVVRVADPAHARPDAVRRQPGDVVFTGILGGFKRSSQTRSLLAYRATPKTDPASPHCDTRRVHFDRRVIWRRCFRRCWWPNLDKHSAVLGLVQDEPALRAGAASGILDKTCARRSARGRSAPRNGPLSLTCLLYTSPSPRD